MAELAFTLEYDGPALAAHEMDVKQLAPALLATAEVFQEMNRVQYPDNPPVSVKIRATRTGSIDVELILVAVAGAVKVLSGPETTALINLTSLLGGFSKLLEYIKFRAGRTPDRVEPVAPGSVRVVLDGVEMEFPDTVEAFHQNPTIKHAVEEIVSPLTKEGVDFVRFKRQEVTIGEVSKEDLQKFIVPVDAPALASRIVNDSVHEMALRVVSPWFKKGNKWKVTDGQNEFWVDVLDEQFVGAVLAGRTALTPQDLLTCEVRVIQELDAEGTLHTRHEILSVVEHLSRPQGDLFS